MAQTNSARAIPFRPDIEGLRAVAVLLVVAYHAQLLGAAGGFVGVDVFFVLSGYLISDILVRQLETDNRIAILKFYARRMLRLLPAVTFVLIITLLVEHWLYSPMERIDVSLSALATALYSSNILFLVRATDYFSAGGAPDALLHTWSLAVEEQFYLVWPLTLFIGWRIARSRSRLAALLAVLVVLSFAGEVWLTHKKQPWAFFAMPARAWEFGLGGIAVLLPQHSLPSALVARILGWVGLGLIVASGALAATSSYPGTWVLVPVLGTTAALIAGRRVEDAGASHLLAHEPLPWIGRHSYSWYLWHWPVLVFAAALVPVSTWWGRFASVVVSLVAAVVTTKFIENPIRFQRRLIERPGRVVAGGIVLTLAMAAICLQDHRVALAKGGAYFRAAHDPTPGDSLGCQAGFTDTQVRECALGLPAAPIQLVLFGDSHAMQWSGALLTIATRHSWGLRIITKYSCPAARAHVYNRVLNRRYEECDAWREAAIQRINALRPAAVIIGQIERGNTAYADDGSIAPLSPRVWLEAQRATLARFSSAGIPTVLLRDSPQPGMSVPKCLSRASMSTNAVSGCAVTRIVALDSVYFGLDKAAAADFQKVGILDVTDQICGEYMCEPIRDGIIVYRDGNHLSRSFVDHLAATVDVRLTALIMRLGCVACGR
jgi:peptidoglycan/LPS O-acetylase OafA/YrhL